MEVFRGAVGVLLSQCKWTRFDLHFRDVVPQGSRYYAQLLVELSGVSSHAGIMSGKNANHITISILNSVTK